MSCICEDKGSVWGLQKGCMVRGVGPLMVTWDHFRHHRTIHQSLVVYSFIPVPNVLSKNIPCSIPDIC